MEQIEQPVKKKKPPKNVSDKYYSLSEEEMQELVAKGQAGDDRALEKILEVFSNFLTKYQSLLYFGKCDLRDYDIRMFMYLFIPGAEDKRRIARNQMNKETFRSVAKTIEDIRFMVTRSGTEDDVKQTVQMAMVECIQKYKRMGDIPFSGYVYNYYRYKLQKYLKSYLLYQLGKKTFPLFTDDVVSSSYSHEDEQITVSDPTTDDALDQMAQMVKIDEYWVLGETCSYPFDQLTIQQRQLIRWRYEDGLKASHIAEKTTEHPNTCRAQIQALKNELRQLLLEETERNEGLRSW